MQSNDLNRLISDYETHENLKDLLISPIPSQWGRASEMPIEEILKRKEPINPDLLKIIRKDVNYYQTLGKSRRWIRRYIKRKYNITEY